MVKVLSLFDGMACGFMAFESAGLEIKQYDAYEIDEYAIKVASHNYPLIRHHGDVFAGDFSQYKGYDFLVGGSPCTYWSIAQAADKRERGERFRLGLIQPVFKSVERGETEILYLRKQREYVPGNQKRDFPPFWFRPCPDQLGPSVGTEPRTLILGW